MGEGASPPPARRVLTKPSEGAEGKPHDNVNSDLIVSVGDELRSQLGTTYIVQDLLGQGTFGQVFRCQDATSKEVVAVKVVKAQPAYFQQARVEVGILQYLNTKADPGDDRHIVRMKDFFVHLSHLCLVFELLSLNLYEVIRRNKFRGFTLALVRVLVLQILSALDVLQQCQIIHCDLKPENVLLKNGRSGEVKVIDFGSACFQSRTVYSYIQSRFYRSPEVILGCPYTPSIDMWSLGCLAAELFLGLPLFPGACEHDMLVRISGTLGPLPEEMVVSGRNTARHYRPADGGARLALRTAAEYEAANGAPAPVGKSYFQSSDLAEIVASYPLRAGASEAEAAREMALRAAFVDFLRGTLALDPARRWTPRQAAAHPFLAGTAADWAALGVGVEALRAPASQPLPMPQQAAVAPPPPPPQRSWQAGGWGAMDAGVSVAAVQPSGPVDFPLFLPAQQPQQMQWRAPEQAVADGGLQYQAVGVAGHSSLDGLGNVYAAPYPAAADYQSVAAAGAWNSSLYGSTPRGSAPYGSLQLTPPSRTFIHQARLLEGVGSWRGSGLEPGLDGGALPSSYSSAGLLPLLPQAALLAQQSVANAAAAAAQQQQYEAAQLAVANALSQQQQLMGARPAYAGEGEDWAAAAGGGYYQPGAAARAAPAAWGAPPAQGTPTTRSGLSAERGGLSPRQPSRLHGGDSGFSGAGVSLDPPPGPGDWDPLWSDDLLREEDEVRGGDSAMSAYHDALAQQPAPQQQQYRGGAAGAQLASTGPAVGGSFDASSTWFYAQQAEQRAAQGAYGSSLPPVAPGRAGLPRNNSGVALFLSPAQQQLQQQLAAAGYAQGAAPYFASQAQQAAQSQQEEQQRALAAYNAAQGAAGQAGLEAARLGSGGAQLSGGAQISGGTQISGGAQISGGTQGSLSWGQLPALAGLTLSNSGSIPLPGQSLGSNPYGVSAGHANDRRDPGAQPQGAGQASHDRMDRRFRGEGP
ncbi:hypothetical protein QBZ16_003371 [Prototheca wickerhamii]|uniref:Protein kinase domain-containing protein n=1 Tax=Prototheca wickerhamii TaxID=3111 RepID=A0AAD9IHE3_PROWI|nr:hypothetical protein QBZ16_003371 [Prototheca wickerhamii]